MTCLKPVKIFEMKSHTYLVDDTKSNRVEQWIRGSPSDVDQPPLGGDTKAEVETQMDVTVNKNTPQLPSTSNQFLFKQTRSQKEAPENSLASPSQFSLSTATPVSVVPSRTQSTPPSLSLCMANQTVTVPMGFQTFSTGQSAYLRELEFQQFHQVCYSE